MRTFITLLFSATFFNAAFAQKTSMGAFAFIENKGQIVDQSKRSNSNVRFLLPIPGMNVQLTAEGFSYDTYVAEKNSTAVEGTKKNKLHLPGKKLSNREHIQKTYKYHRIDVVFEGALPNTEITAGEPMADYINSYTANGEYTKLKQYRSVVYRNLYNGIDLELIAGGKENQPFEYNFIVRPGADESQIKIHYKGAFATALTQHNTIQIKTAHGVMEEKIPLSYEQKSSKKVQVNYLKVSDNTYGLKAASYNRSQTLIIDPTPERSWGTYYGGISDEVQDYFDHTALDAGNNLYVCGYSQSASAIATTGAHQTTLSGTVDAFLVKFNSNGVRQWATYYGGSDNDFGSSVETDVTGAVYLGGSTRSTNAIATTGAHQTTIGGLEDGFIIKFNADGVRQWGTYYGGTQSEELFNITSSGSDLYFSGTTNSNSAISTPGAHQVAFGGGNQSDGFIVKFNSNGVRQWSTYYGASGYDAVYNIRIDAAQNIYASGESASATAISTAGSHQSNYGGGETDGLLAKFNSNGVRQWATYYGGGGEDALVKANSDASGNIYITGATSSNTNIATPGAYQTALGGGIEFDGLIVKFNSSGVREWGTYYGGVSFDAIFNSALSSDGSLYIAGTTEGSAGLSTAGSYQVNYGGGFADGFIAKFNSNGSRQWGSYYGGSAEDNCNSIVLAANGEFYISGYTNSSNAISSPGSHQPNYGGGANNPPDLFIAKFADVVTGVSDLSIVNGIKLYPNPASKELVIQFSGNSTPVALAIYDASGKLVQSERILTARNIPFRLPVKNLAEGMYLVKVWDDKKQLIAAEQIIVQR